MDWKHFDKKTIINAHDDMYKYRDLYEGKHSGLFTRAEELIKKGEVIDYLENGKQAASNVRTPYLVYNISKIICDVPALLISRSMGEVLTNHKHQEATEQESSGSGTEMIEGTRDDSTNEEIEDLQQELITQIVSNSTLTRKHKSNILQHQVDGGIVGVPIIKDGNATIQFKERNVYYPHEDDLGADLVYELDNPDDNLNDYVHVYTERRETDDLLVATNRLYKRNRLGNMTEVTDGPEIEAVTGIKVRDLTQSYKGRKRLFMDYWGNDVTFMNPLGVSALKGQEGKQEEVNWTLTRMSMTLERNGKPRISITKELFDRLEGLAEERGDGRIDYRDLEVTEMDEQGNSLETHQIDIDKIGDIDYMKDITRAMLAETGTSEKATDLLSDTSGAAAAQSGVAKFYDLFISLIKAESLRNEYVEFLQNLFESTLWLANRQNDKIIIEKPYIELKSMIPTPKQEKDTNSINKYTAGTQSLETTVREIHVDKTDEWVSDEVDRILSEASSDDSMSLANGRQSILNMFGNRDPEGNPTDEAGNTVGGGADDNTATE